MTPGGRRAARAGAGEPRTILVADGAHCLGAAMTRQWCARRSRASAARGGGAVLTTASVADLAPATGPYHCAAKHALIGLTQAGRPHRQVPPTSRCNGPLSP